MKKGIIAIVLTVLVGVGTVTILTAFVGKPTEYTTEAAKHDGIAEEIDVTANIKGEEKTTYYSNVTAPVCSYNLKVGDTVLGGQQVLSYDTEDLEKALEQAVLTAESTENTMNGQIAASNKKASLYNKAVADSDIYMQLYAAVRASNDSIDQGQYQENWDIGIVADGLEKAIADKNVSISRKNEELTNANNMLNSLDVNDPLYQFKAKDISAQVSAIQSEIASLNTSIASLNSDLASLPPASLNPQEYAAEIYNGNWMSDIMRNWTQSTTVKNTYESQILNSYQKDQLQNSYDLSALNVTNAKDNILKANEGVMVDYNGIVTESFVNSGSVVSKGSPLFTIESSDNLKAEAGISKYDIGKIELGQRAIVEIAGRTYEGSVSEINRLAQTTNSDKAKVNVSIHIDNPDEYVYLGLEADVTIFANEKSSAIIIPIDGYYSDDDGDYCYLIKDGVIEKRYIKTGVASDKYIEVTEGIFVGDVIVTDAITDSAVGKKAVAK